MKTAALSLMKPELYLDMIYSNTKLTKLRGKNVVNDKTLSFEI